MQALAQQFQQMNGINNNEDEDEEEYEMHGPNCSCHKYVLLLISYY